MMNRKERYRLYKSGRRWVAVLLVTAAISGGLAMAVPVV
ncbi:KxYKxGKxW signal peptide domain-containing protein [Schleiferilactobacillus harbinensis]|nr:KxYKxGKxW signal peptide domain-containing protein [Schleiferilactobacillus harbinensis]